MSPVAAGRSTRSTPGGTGSARRSTRAAAASYGRPRTATPIRPRRSSPLGFVSESSRRGAIDVPVPCDGGEPAAVLAGREPEAADDALSALVVAVEDLDREGLPRVDGGLRGGEIGGGGITERALPEADVAGGDVEVAGQPREVLERRVVVLTDPLQIEAPPVEDGDAAADVSQRDREVDGLVGRLGRTARAGRVHPLSVRVPDLLRRIVEPRGHEQRTQAEQQRLFGRARRAVRRPDGGERRH